MFGSSEVRGVEGGAGREEGRTAARAATSFQRRASWLLGDASTLRRRGPVPRDVRFLGLNPERRRKAACGRRAASGGRRPAGGVTRNYAAKLRLPEGLWRRVVRACACRQPASGEASAGRLNPGATLVGGTCGCGSRVGHSMPGSLHLRSDHDRYVSACQVQRLCAAPPGLGGQGPPGCPPVSTVSVRAAVLARPQPAPWAPSCPPWASPCPSWASPCPPWARSRSVCSTPPPRSCFGRLPAGDQFSRDRGARPRASRGGGRVARSHGGRGARPDVGVPSAGPSGRLGSCLRGRSRLELTACRSLSGGP